MHGVPGTEPPVKFSRQEVALMWLSMEYMIGLGDLRNVFKHLYF